MTEDEARDWLRDAFGAAALTRLEHFVTLLLAEAEKQSLIARSTFDLVWGRHIADSAQLVPLAPADGVWVDVGSGGGLPGLVVALLRDAPMVLVEPRRKRTDFLRAASAELALAHVSVLQANVQSAEVKASVVSARAVSNLVDLFAWTRPIVSRETLYLLPRGENAVSDLDIARRAWHGVFHVEQSLTDPTAGIVVAKAVRPR